MLISATTRFKSLLPEHLGQLSSATQVFAYAALFCIVCSVGFAAWAIYPRLKIGPEIGPISWVEISSFSKVELFVHASLELRSPKAVKLMARQVYYMSRVCRRKNRLIQIALSFMAVAWLISITLIAKA